MPFREHCFLDHVPCADRVWVSGCGQLVIKKKDKITSTVLET